jgi:4-amino-4-deoxy-L-arabinose transferase-like glycosyltransferase
VAPRINKRDLPWVVLIAVSFIFGLAASWERWGNPLVDCGREMNQPLRLAAGQMLYSDVRHIYGPLSPYINATLYRIFGPSLGVLYADGIFTALMILALVYWLSRQLMGRAAAVAATLSVTWLCAFKQAGNYVLPYSYSALHGCALGLASVALLVRFVQKRDEETRSQISAEDARRRRLAGSWLLLAAAGAMAALATLAKTEMGFAATVTGVTAVVLAGFRAPRRALVPAAMFLVPAVGLVVVVYALIAARVGWHTLSADSFLFFHNLSPELVYFNKRVSGFDQPLQAVGLMLGATVKIASLAIIIATISLLVTRRKKPMSAGEVKLADLRADAGRVSYLQLWLLLALSTLLFVAIPLVGALQWDKGPYLAMPLLLAGFLLVVGYRFLKQLSKSGDADRRPLVLIVVAVYALASLTRVILRVRSGGAYSSYLLPASVIMFTYGWARPFADLFRDGRARRLARNLAIGLIIVDAIATSGLLAYRYRTRNTHSVVTARGTMIAVPDVGESVDQAIDFINREIPEGNPLAVMPEGTSLNFFTGRPNPLREEITTPGFLDAQGEERAIRQLIDSNTQVVMVTNRPTPEFGASIFGRDYCRRLMQWVEENFEQVAIFGPDHDPNLQIGDKTFFIRAYKRKA